MGTEVYGQKTEMYVYSGVQSFTLRTLDAGCTAFTTTFSIYRYDKAVLLTDCIRMIFWDF